MSNQLFIINEAVLIPLTFLIFHYDTRYRRIPNAFVLGTLISGLGERVTHHVAAAYKSRCDATSGLVRSWCSHAAPARGP